MPTKLPVSVLVVVYSLDSQVLLLERADLFEGWQSVTGSLEPGETLLEAATREVFEETGLVTSEHGGLLDWSWANQYEILPQFRHRYPPGTRYNTEHVFSLALNAPQPVTLNAAEHLSQCWLPWRQAADKVFSPSNARAILAKFATTGREATVVV